VRGRLGGGGEVEREVAVLLEPAPLVAARSAPQAHFHLGTRTHTHTKRFERATGKSRAHKIQAKRRGRECVRGVGDAESKIIPTPPGGAH